MRGLVPLSADLPVQGAAQQIAFGLGLAQPIGDAGLFGGRHHGQFALKALDFFLITIQILG